MKRNKHAERAEVLFDLLADGDHTYETIQDKTGWTRGQVLKAVQKLRDILATNGDVISVVAEPQGKRDPWVYRLKGGKDILDAEQSQWVINRLQDTERRVATIENVLAVAVNALDGRTTHGKKARIYHLHIKRAREEVALMEPEQLSLDGS